MGFISRAFCVAFGCGLVITLAIPAVASSELGSIEVTVTSDDPDVPVEGWEYSLSSGNCDVGENFTDRTDEAGEVRFTGLDVYTDESEQVECRYDLTSGTAGRFAAAD